MTTTRITITTATVPQMELTFESTAPGTAARPRRQRRLLRARWWFDHMRQVVDQALDHGRSGPPEQIYFSLARQPHA